MSVTNNQTNVNLKDIAKQQLGNIRWEADTKGFCTCPGDHLHSSATADRECVVYLDEVPTIFCMHQSCAEEVKDANRTLRAAILNGQPVDPDKKASAQEIKQKQKEAQRTNQLELRGRSSLPKLLKDYQWTYEGIEKDTPDKLESDSSVHWKHIVGLFKPDDVIWMGNKTESGNSANQCNFKPAQEWLTYDEVDVPLTCPAVFKSNSFARTNDNALRRPFLVVESDVLSKDEVGAIFKWLRDEVGLTLRAVVDTAGKSLHGWFDMPKEAIVKQLKIILPQLGCDKGLFTASQPCRIPGALRDGKYQKLIYLDKTAKARTAKQPSGALPLPELYYDGSGQCFWRANSHGGWQKINEKTFDSELLAQGFSTDAEGIEPLSESGRAKRAIQLDQDVAYVGRLAGYHSGLHNILGQRILVTDSANILTPKPGDWSTLQRFFEGVLGDQVDYFYGWMKLGFESLTSGVFTTGQAFAIAGPAGCGKSLLQNVITELIGGRVAKPYHFMTGKTPFNSEVFGAEHLMVEDESASTKIEARRALGAAIKNITANVTQPCFGKNKAAIILTPFWRLTMSMNEEPEDLMVLPPFDDGIADKLMLVKGYENDVVRGTDTKEKRKRLWETFMKEIPAFLAHLQTWQIPDALKADRFGIKTYHNPQLLIKMRELQPEQRLMSLIDDCIFRHHMKHSFEGMAIGVERLLTDNEYSLCHEARNLLRAQNSCGTYLGRLAKYPDARVVPRLLHGQTLWKIVAPGGEQQEATE